MRNFDTAGLGWVRVLLSGQRERDRRARGADGAVGVPTSLQQADQR